MIDDLIINGNEVTWTHNKKRIKVEVSKVYFASIKDENYICLECGENFILESVYYLDLEGKLKFSYNLRKKYILLENSEKIQIENLILAGYFPKKNKILVLIGEKNIRMLAYDLSGKFLFEIKSPSGYQMKYFQEAEGDLFVVCEGDEQHKDQFGRFHVNFRIDLNNGSLKEHTLGY